MKKMWIMLFVGVSVVSGFLLSGCEKDTSSSSVITISPANVTVIASQHQTIQFTALGGDGNYTNYLWQVSTNANGAYGSIQRSGKSVLYQSNSSTGVCAITVLDGSGFSGIAFVTQN